MVVRKLKELSENNKELSVDQESEEGKDKTSPDKQENPPQVSEHVA